MVNEMGRGFCSTGGTFGKGAKAAWWETVPMKPAFAVLTLGRKNAEACCFLSISIHSFGEWPGPRSYCALGWLEGGEKLRLLPETPFHTLSHGINWACSTRHSFLYLSSLLSSCCPSPGPPPGLTHTTLWPGWHVSPVQRSNAGEVLFSVRIEIRYSCLPIMRCACVGLQGNLDCRSPFRIWAWALRSPVDGGKKTPGPPDWKNPA